MFDEKLIIKQFLENQKLALPSALNASNLTLVLRSIGFFLHEFDIGANGGNPEDANLSIEIKCSKSGLISKLYLPYHDCHCQGENPPENKAFWEVHGNQPNSPSCSNATSPGGTTIVHETATNLLPEVDHTWKVLAKNMFNFMIRMQNGIAKYKDEQNNMEYGDISITAKEVESHSENEQPLELKNNLLSAITTGEDNDQVSPMNQDESPVFLAVKQLQTPYSTPLSSINVTPVVTANIPIVRTIAASEEEPLSSLTESSSSGCHEESIVISLVMDAKAKLDQALLRLKFNSVDENIFQQSFPLNALSDADSAVPPLPEKLIAENKIKSATLVRRRSTNSNGGSTSSAKTPTEPSKSKVTSRVGGRLSTGSVEIRKSTGAEQKKPKVMLPTHTRTSALRNQKAKN